MENFLDSTWFEIYINAMYWSTSTVMLIGAKPYTTTETIFTLVTLFSTVGVFAYIISAISKYTIYNIIFIIIYSRFIVGITK